MPTLVVQRIQALREERPRWGREKLRVLLEREGITLSAKTLDRVLARRRARGVLREPLRPRKTARGHRERLRRPKDLVVDQPGALVQVDTKQVPLCPGRVVYQFGAVDCFTRKPRKPRKPRKRGKRVVALAPRLTSAQGAEFLRRMVAQFPFPVQSIQSEGGSEFLKECGPAGEELQRAPYFNRPNYPQSLP